MSNDSFREYIDELKAKVDFVAEIEATGPGYGMQDRAVGGVVSGIRKGSGGPGDSLEVRLDWGIYKWWRKGGESGDIFHWMQRYRNMEFWPAVEYLAGKYNHPIPSELRQMDDTDRERITAYKQRVELFEIACRWFETQLAKKENQAAMAYALGRGWSTVHKDEQGKDWPGSIQKARLGFSGRGTPEERKDLIGDLQMYGHDPECPVAVAIVGYAPPGGKDDILAWGKKWGVELRSNWIEKGRIYGMLDFPRLLYPHIFGGRVGYFSARNLAWKKGELIGQEKPKSHNLAKALVGPRKPFFNFEYNRGEKSVVIVEGPADAITLGQWGQAAAATMGLKGDDMLRLLEDLRNRHKRVYFALESGAPAWESLSGAAATGVGQGYGEWEVAKALGPMAWLLRWPQIEGVGDANDWLMHMIGEEVDFDGQMRKWEQRLGTVKPMAVIVAEWAGKQRGADKRDAAKTAFELIGKMDVDDRAQYRKQLAGSMDYSVREYDNILKKHVKTDKGNAGDIEETLGGVFGNYLVEYLYDAAKDEARLAWRDYTDPTAQVEEGEDLVVDGLKLVPKPPSDFVRRGAVLFPSAVGKRKAMKDLIVLLEGFIHRYYLLPDKYLAKIMAYYVLLTWIYDSFEALTYLRATGDAGAGKSELMKRVGYLCYRLTMASGANTSATFFRTVEMYKGTVFIDEADLNDGGDMANDLVKFLNLGAMKGNVISRLVEVTNWNGDRTYEPMAFDTFCPKLIAMREDFKDKAVGSRALTVKLMARESMELKMAGIPLHINREFREHALRLRNMLLRWRLENWVPEIELTDELMDVNLPARMNQVTMPIKALTLDGEGNIKDTELYEEIERFLRAYNLEIIGTRSMTMDAYIVEAMWNLYNDAGGAYLQRSREGEQYLWMADIRKEANRITDEINQGGSAPEPVPTMYNKNGEPLPPAKKKGKELTAPGVGKIIRNNLQIRVGNRQGTGIPVYWDEIKMVSLGKKFGVLPLDWEPPAE